MIEIEPIFKPKDECVCFDCLNLRAAIAALNTLKEIRDLVEGIDRRLSNIENQVDSIESRSR